MPELRQDPITGRWVSIAAARSGRPQEFHSETARVTDVVCPFCEGREHMTPGEVFAYRDPRTAPDSPGWRVRVVPNKFPAVLPGAGHQSSHDELYLAREATGTHEVIIESPRHVSSLTDLSDDATLEVLLAYRERLCALREDDRHAYGLVFKNVGDAAGASLEHVHSQLIATSIVPHQLSAELQIAADFYQRRGVCIFCELVQRECASRVRVVVDLPHHVAFCPFASRLPYETWILPKLHESHFELMASERVAELAHGFRDVLARLESVTDRCAYNYLVHTSPFDMPTAAHYHWHIELLPRVVNLAGFEWGTGFYINPVPPEEAACHLRETVV